MKSSAATVKEYLAELPAVRRVRHQRGLMRGTTLDAARHRAECMKPTLRPVPPFRPTMTIPFQSRYAPRSSLWVLEFAGIDCEVLVGGGPDALDPARADLAVWAVERLDVLVSRAARYLEHYVDIARLDGTGWELVALELGLRAEDGPDELQVLLLMEGGEDTGAWRVRIRRSPTNVTGLFANAFGYTWI